MRWDDVIRVITSLPPHRDLAVPKGLVPHPAASGFRRRRLAEPRGQRSDWEVVLGDGRSVHVREYGDYYLVHWDWASPSRSALKHLLYDAPHWLAPLFGFAVVAVGAAAGVADKVAAAGGLLAAAALIRAAASR